METKKDVARECAEELLDEFLLWHPISGQIKTGERMDLFAAIIRRHMAAENAELREVLVTMLHELPTWESEARLNRHRINHREGTVESIQIAKDTLATATKRIDAIKNAARTALGR